MKKQFLLLGLLALLTLTGCSVTQTRYAPVYRTSYVATTTSVSVDDPPYAGYAFSGSWYAGAPDYYDTTISVLDD